MVAAFPQCTKQTPRITNPKFLLTKINSHDELNKQRKNILIADGSEGYASADLHVVLVMLPLIKFK